MPLSMTERDAILGDLERCLAQLGPRVLHGVWAPC
jgi:hypothetical protein